RPSSGPGETERGTCKRKERGRKSFESRYTVNERTTERPRNGYDAPPVQASALSFWPVTSNGKAVFQTRLARFWPNKSDDDSDTVNVHDDAQSVAEIKTTAKTKSSRSTNTKDSDQKESEAELARLQLRGQAA
ncbi:unnamed protein product, partial [Amoebophrya sp. A120]